MHTHTLYVSLSFPLRRSDKKDKKGQEGDGAEEAAGEGSDKESPSDEKDRRVSFGTAIAEAIPAQIK